MNIRKCQYFNWLLVSLYDIYYILQMQIEANTSHGLNALSEEEYTSKCKGIDQINVVTAASVDYRMMHYSICT